MAQRRQQQQQQRRQQYQRSPGNYGGPPAKRPRTNVPPPLPPLDWDYEYQDRSRQGRYPPALQYSDYDRIQDYQMHNNRGPSRDYMPSYQPEEYYTGGGGGGGGGNRNDYRNQRQAPRRQQGHDNYRDRPHMQQRQQNMQRGPQMNQRGQQQQRGNQGRRGGGGGGGGGGGRNRNQGGSGDGRRRRDRNRNLASPRSGDRRDNRDDRQDSAHRNWTKTYWIGKGDNQSKRPEKKIDAEISEDYRFKIFCGMMKAKFRVSSSAETMELFLGEKTVGLKPSFVFKRDDGCTSCKFYLNSIFVSEGTGLTRFDAKNAACDNAIQIFERETPDSILTAHEKVEVSKLGEEADALDHSMISHLERFQGDKPLSNFVVLQTDGRTDEGKWNWISILVQSAAFSRMELHFQLQGQEYRKINCNVQIGGKFIYSGRGRLVKDAKNSGAKGAVEKLQKTCYTLLIKEGTKDEEKSLPGIPLQEMVGNIDDSQAVEEFRSKTEGVFKKYAEEEDMTKPLVILMTAFSNEEKEAILEVAKNVGYVQRDADIRRSRREEEKKEQEKREKERKEKERKEKEEKERQKKEQEKTESEEASTKEETKEEEKEEVKPEETEEAPESKPEETTKQTEEAAKAESNETEGKKEETTEEKKEETTEEKKEEKEEEPPKIVLIRKYSGIDTLEYVLNKGGETWKYKVRPPGPPPKEEKEESKEEEKKEESKDEAAADENGAEGDGEGADAEGMMDEEGLECVDQADCGESGDENEEEDMVAEEGDGADEGNE